MSKKADARREMSLAGAPSAYPANGSITPTAPKHRVTHPKSTGVLRPFTDYIPAPELRRDGQHWSKDADRDWRGIKVGCYHGTSHNGKAVLCEGERCKFAPRENRPRSGRVNPTQQPVSDTHTVRAHLARIGYTGPMTPQLRTLVMDAIVFEAQCAEMASE